MGPIRQALLWFCALALSTAAYAVPLQWTISATFEDGGTASGSFVYDATANLFSQVNITTTTGSIRTGATYVRANLVAARADLVLVITSASGDLTGTPILGASLVSPMTNAGGTIQINLSALYEEDSCGNAACTGVTAPRRTITSGSVTSVAVP